jgi:hypothetical protein
LEDVMGCTYLWVLLYVVGGLAVGLLLSWAHAASPKVRAKDALDRFPDARPGIAAWRAAGRVVAVLESAGLIWVLLMFRGSDAAQASAWVHMLGMCVGLIGLTSAAVSWLTGVAIILVRAKSHVAVAAPRSWRVLIPTAVGVALLALATTEFVFSIT